MTPGDVMIHGLTRANIPVVCFAKLGGEKEGISRHSKVMIIKILSKI